MLASPVECEIRIVISLCDEFLGSFWARYRWSIHPMNSALDTQSRKKELEIALTEPESDLNRRQNRMCSLWNLTFTNLPPAVLKKSKTATRAINALKHPSCSVV